MSIVKVKKIRGCAACDISERGEELQLENLEVSVFFRNQGVGSAMIERVKSLGKVIRLFPQAEPGRSRDLLRFYRKRGFKPCRDGYWRWRPFLTMIALVFTIASSFAAPPQGYAERMADAIYISEGGAKTKWPYGVKSITPPTGTSDKAAWARKITINSVNNNWKRWEKAGKPEPFVKFMARRWVPESADLQGHTNWVKNVNKLMEVSK
jgi:hypothetical protein